VILIGKSEGAEFTHVSKGPIVVCFDVLKIGCILEGIVIPIQLFQPSVHYFTHFEQQDKTCAAITAKKPRTYEYSDTLP
jgi:hypothetical protein